MAERSYWVELFGSFRILWYLRISTVVFIASLHGNPV
jgi:hypothetical protein